MRRRRDRDGDASSGPCSKPTASWSKGDLTLPPAGYQSRFSDSLNRGEFEFVPLTNAKVTSLDTGTVSELPFVVLSKRHIRVAYPTPD